jgi:hypothetical protein
LETKGAIKWVTQGDTCTKFFHSNAIIRHRINLIAIVKDEEGNELHEHEDKERFLWKSYKQRLGTSDFSNMYYDLQNLLTSADNLDCQHETFSKEEINAIVQSLPIDKSPGLDGFNEDFLKRCWPMIAADFYELCPRVLWWENLYAKHK